MLGLGIDIVEIARIEAALSRQGQALAERVLLAEELPGFLASKQPARYLAKRFAAKEAISKALGTGIAKGVGFHSMCVTHDELGAPQVRLLAGAEQRLAQLGGSQCRVSISDERHYVVANAVIF